MTPTKVCFKCDRRKPLDDFYKHKMMADGHLGKCKACAKKDVAKNYRDNIDAKRAYERERFKRPERKAKLLEYQRKQRANSPGKDRARAAVAHAIRDGRLIRGPCEVCGTTSRVHGHHDDYRRPLVVRWLCFRHHMEHHGKVADPALA